MIYRNFKGQKLSQLGFGCMRFASDPETGEIDQAKVNAMFDLAIREGVNYFDTAYPYLGGKSEIAMAEALSGYPRESYYLADKFPGHSLTGPIDNIALFNVSLRKCRTDYFDFYLLHAIQTNNYKKYDEYGIWDYVKGLKEEGLVKNYGFSFHATPELLDKILTEHPDVDFIQLQINYADWENPSVQSRGIYEVARKHSKPIVIMEPVKGGNLANPPQEVKKIFDEVNPGASYASWAIRFAASLDGVLTVLSGMSDTEQMKDNLSYMKDFKPLNEAEQEAIGKAQAVYGKLDTIPCTACRYCTEGCPKSINIPEIFKAVNHRNSSGQIERSAEEYAGAVNSAGRASDCIKCRQCEKACPQHIKITEELEKAAGLFD